MAKSEKLDLGTVLAALDATVRAKKGGDPAVSYTAQLMARGTAKIAQKLGEEAVETVIEAIRGDRKALALESADLLYHLVVLWADAGIGPDDVAAVLAKRRGVGGLEEKARRK